MKVLTESSSLSAKTLSSLLVEFFVKTETYTAFKTIYINSALVQFLSPAFH